MSPAARDSALIEDADGAPLPPSLQRDGKAWQALFNALHVADRRRSDVVDDLARLMAPFVQIEAAANLLDGPPVADGSDAWYNRRRRAWNEQARQLYDALGKFEEEHPDDSICLQTAKYHALRAIRTMENGRHL